MLSFTKPSHLSAQASILSSQARQTLAWSGLAQLPRVPALFPRAFSALHASATSSKPISAGFSLRQETHKSFARTLAGPAAISKEAKRTKTRQEQELVNAAAAGDVELLHKLIETEGLDPNATDYDRRSALHLACAEGKLDAIKYLVEKGANVNAKDRFGATPLDDAHITRRMDVVEYLRSHGAVSGHTPKELTAALSQAAAQGDVEMMKSLIDVGTEINKTDPSGRAPLHYAAAEGQVAAVELLLKRGADANIVDRFGTTPLLEARRGRGRGNRSVAKVLEEIGAAAGAHVAGFTGGSLQSSLQSSLPMLCERGNFSYVDTWLPSRDGAEFIPAEWYARRENLEKVAAARQGLERTEFKEEGSPLTVAYTTRKPVIAELARRAEKNRYLIQIGYKYKLVVPIITDGEIVAILLFYSPEPITMTGEEVESFSEFSSHLIQAGLYGTSRPIPFRPIKDISVTQMQEVYEFLVDEGVFNANTVYHEVDWFYNMGFPVHYFKRFTGRVLANHIHSYIAAKKFAATTGNPENIWLHIENNPKLLGGDPGVGPEQALYMVPDVHSVMVAVERGLERRMSMIKEDTPYNLEYYLSAKPHVPHGSKRLGIYILQAAKYVNPHMVGSNETNIWEVASDEFLRDKTKLIRDRYQEIINEAINRLSPVARVYETYRDGTTPIMFAFSQSTGSTTSYMLQLTELLKQGDLVCTRKFVETFANGLIVFSLYIKPVEAKKVETLLKQFSMLHLVPKSALTPSFLSGEYSAEEYTYTTAGSRFIYYFINQRSEEYEVLANVLKNDPLNLGRLRLLHTSLKREAVSQSRINESLLAHPHIIEELFKDFNLRITTDQKTSPVPDNAALIRRIKNEATSPLDEQIMLAMLTFNKHVVKTNFYKRKKASLSFRLDPGFLAGQDWPQIPYGVFFVMGSDFQGFQVRFEDVSRGGIRLIRSRDMASYNKNLSTMFSEAYGLAYTQNKKNKDIPEFGSKGTVLLNPESQSNAVLAFQKFCAGLLDLLIPNKDVVDNYGKPELLFLGPDEGTAGSMEWAAKYAARRGYPYWRSFTTGKPPSMGGIPHDLYGMTTRSVHTYVLGCLRKLGLKEEDITKCQTGGPDGDLGSNEILISKDKTKVVIDGSGVLYDPKGIDREELLRLARLRVMIKDFDTSKLNDGGFKVLVTDQNITLPHGEKVESGLAFRNEFHLHELFTADLFVPCGGRPETVNLSNVKSLLQKDGTPKFKIIVEGANLFFTQDARMVLENAGVILYKDASTNKGGVTSSSLEVFAALAMNDAEFEANMCVKDPENIPRFYEEYVQEILKRIENDANLEFECIWREHERTKTHRYLLTDYVSEKINVLNKFINQSNLWDNIQIRDTVLREAVPQRLQELKPLDEIMKSVPESYMRAIFAAYLSSRYVYKHGLDANEFAFFEFMLEYIRKSQGGKLQIMMPPATSAAAMDAAAGHVGAAAAEASVASAAAGVPTTAGVASAAAAATKPKAKH